MTTEPSVSEDGWLLPRLQPVYPLAIPCQRTGYSDTYLPVQDDLGKEKGGRLPGDRAAPRREAERLHLTSNNNLTEVVEEVVESARTAVNGKVLIQRPTARQRVQGVSTVFDRERFRQALSILLDNAVKKGPLPMRRGHRRPHSPGPGGVGCLADRGFHGRSCQAIRAADSTGDPETASERGCRYVG
jgi:hypothetical protein